MVSGETGDNSGAEKDVFSSAQFSVDRRRRRRRRLRLVRSSPPPPPPPSLSRSLQRASDRLSPTARQKRGEERRADQQRLLLPISFLPFSTLRRLRANLREREGGREGERGASEQASSEPGRRRASVRVAHSVSHLFVMMSHGGAVARARSRHSKPPNLSDSKCFVGPVAEWYSSLSLR